jgi:Ni,Fe-hydrogenase III small subunit
MLKTLRQIARIGIVTEPPPTADDALRVCASPRDLRAAFDERIRTVLGRALCIRHIDAGSCNGCELEIQALNNPIYNLEGLGIRFVASPRHADLLLVTGPVSRHMEVALRRTYEATPDPKLVVALGDCGCTGGIFGENYASRGRVSQVIPVDVAVPGCPPSPTRILQGILTALSPSPAKTATPNAASAEPLTTGDSVPPRK